MLNGIKIPTWKPHINSNFKFFHQLQLQIFVVCWFYFFLSLPWKKSRTCFSIMKPRIHSFDWLSENACIASLYAQHIVFFQGIAHLKGMHLIICKMIECTMTKRLNSERKLISSSRVYHFICKRLEMCTPDAWRPAWHLIFYLLNKEFPILDLWILIGSNCFPVSWSCTEDAA